MISASRMQVRGQRGTFLKLIALLALILWASTTRAQNTYYIAVNGTDSGSCTTTARCATVAYARSKMVAGDTLVIGDGTYNQCINTPVSGSGSGATAYTTYKAEHDWAATFSTSSSSCAGAVLENYNGSYIIVQGLKLDGQNAVLPIQLGGNHIKLIRIAASGAPCSGNVTAAGTTGTDYVLFEDVHVWGCGRYLINIYHSNHTVLRRVVSRYDFDACDNWGAQSSTFTVYDSDNTVLENVIAIDSGIKNGSLYTCDQLFGGIWWENHGDVTYNGLVERTGTVLGSIFLNLYSFNNSTNSITQNPVGVESRFKLSGNTSVHTERNNVYWDNEDGSSYGISVDAGNPGNPTLDLQHNLYGNSTGTYAGGNGATLGVGLVNGSSGYTSNTFANSLVINNNSYGNNGEPGDYNDYWNNGSGGNAHYLNVSPGAHDKAVNPGLLHLPHIETNSLLRGAASDGGDIGPNIIYEYGVSGTLWGDPGYDQLTTNPLWPFPHESVIKQDMSSYNCAPTCTSGNYPPAVRGFTSTGNGLYGGSITLTSYIWEYLGNPCPSNICNYGPPQPDFSVAATSNSLQVTAGGSATDTITIAALNGFAGTVSLAVPGLPSGASGNFSPASVSTSGSSVLTISTTTSMAPGTYTLTITGTSGSTTHTATAILNVTSATQPDFTLSASSSSLRVTGGGSATDTASIAALNGFTGTVSLAVSGLPSGASGSFSPASVSTSGSSVLSITTTASTAAGAYTLTITGASGSTSHTTTVTLNVAATGQPDFTLSASSSSLQVTAGGSTTDTVTIAALSGFMATVSLAVSGLPSGASGSFSPANVTTSGSSVLSITIPASTAAVAYTLTITGTSGSTSHTTTVTLNVAAARATVSVAVNPGSATLSKGQSAQLTVTATGSSTISSPSFSCTGLPSYATCQFGTASVAGNGQIATSTLTLSVANQIASSSQPQNTQHALMASLAMFSLVLFGLGLAVERRRKTSLLLAGIVMLFVTTLGGCSALVTTPNSTFSFSVAGTVHENGTTATNSASVSVTMN
jgi:hypothetical protein